MSGHWVHFCCITVVNSWSRNKDGWLSSLPETENRQEDSDEGDLWHVRQRAMDREG